MSNRSVTGPLLLAASIPLVRCVRGELAFARVVVAADGISRHDQREQHSLRPRRELMKARSPLLLVCCCLVAAAVHAQERPLVSLEQLIVSLDEAHAITEAAFAFRSRLGEDLPAPEFAEAMAELQRRCEPILMLIIQTNPPRELQRFAMNIAMGLKGVELALWHYIYGVLSGQGDHISYADELLTRGRAELQFANELSTEIR
jgi:hypothetical protein